MNASRKQAPKRYSPLENEQYDCIPHGTYHVGIQNPDFAITLGQIATFWPHVEEAMIVLMRDLLGGSTTTPARQIFQALIPTRVRADSFRAFQTGASQIPWRRTGGSPCGQELHFART